MASDKDFWDKLEICGKTALPIVVALAAVFLNNQINTRAQASEWTKIALSVINKPLDQEDTNQILLRTWAVDVLADPTKLHSIDEDTKQALLNSDEPFDVSGWGLIWDAPGVAMPWGSVRDGKVPFIDSFEPTRESCNEYYEGLATGKRVASMYMIQSCNKLLGDE